MQKIVKTTVPLLASVATALALTAPADAASDPTVGRAKPIDTRVDLDGDHRPDKVVLEVVPDNPDEQQLVATVSGIRLTARIPLHSYPGIRPLRVVDIDADGRDEIIVTESVGANTLGFTAWGLFGGLRPVTSPDGTPLPLWEGGGASAIARYGCEPADGGQRLVTVQAGVIDWENFVYQGERVTYAVHDGVAVEATRTPAVGPRDAVPFLADPQTCA